MRARDRLGRPVPVDSPDAVLDPPSVPLSEALELARTLAAVGRWYSAHDVLEEAWKADRDGPWQGLAQVCVGMTHLQRGNAVGGARLLRRGAATLAGHADHAGLARRAEDAAARAESGDLPTLAL
ncbi:MAG: DUF309 domain-containing protein [Mycobacteriales bacterium]|nr:DUF309 domain-containing protein [Mycobacteriales bacterium]